jgi:uncharacterized membrane protein (UPF0127 family)
MRLILFVVSLCLTLVSCGGSGNEVSSMEDFHTRDVGLPDGTTVRAEVLTRPQDMARGMMFRDSLAPGRGMLFIHEKPEKYGYWMYQTKVALDIIWMDRQGRIVEISENTPPCPGKASTCPTYGGTVASSIVLELPAGYGSKHGVRVGETIRL